MNHFAKEILELLEGHGFSAYIVGGYVRDFLLGINSTDVDICTNAKINEITSFILGTVNEYNSLNIKKNELNIDITTFRIEGAYLNRRPTILSHTNDLESDLLRRDFTMNAICMDKNGNIIDPLNGRKDLKQGVIRMIGDTNKKIIEDPLRILRAIRFATVLDFTLAPTLYKEIEKNGKLLKTLSSYRKKEEIGKILVSPNLKKGLKLLKKLHLCEYLGIRFKNVVYTKDVCGMWAQLEICDEFPFTKQEKKNIVKVQEIVDLKRINREVVFEYGLSLSLTAGEILGVSADFIYALYNSMKIHSRKDLNISFDEIKEITLLEPKQVRKLENILLKEVINGRLENDKNKLRDYLLKYKTR